METYARVVLVHLENKFQRERSGESLIFICLAFRGHSEGKQTSALGLPFGPMQNSQPSGTGTCFPLGQVQMKYAFQSRFPFFFPASLFRPPVYAVNAHPWGAGLKLSLS